MDLNHLRSDKEMTLEFSLDPDSEAQSIDKIKKITETIDLNNLFAAELTFSGSFDLHQVKYATFDSLLQALSVPSLVVGKSHKVESVNEAFIKMAGNLNPIGFTIQELFESSRDVEIVSAIIAKVFQERKSEVIEREFRIRKVNIWGRIHFRTIRLVEDHLVLIQIENLTAERQLAITKKYQKLVHTFPLGVAEFVLEAPLLLTLGPNELVSGIKAAVIADGNKEFAAVYKLKNIQRMKGIRFDVVFPLSKRGNDFFHHWVRDVLPIRMFVTREGRNQGHIRHFENTFIPNVIDEKLFGFWWMKKDISERKKIQEERLKTQKLESLGILAGGIAHDFNNLLTGILGNISVAQLDPVLNPKTQMRLRWAVKAIRRAQDLTHQLLTFAKGGAPVKTLMNPASVVKDCALFALRGSNVRCEFEIDEDCKCIEADVGQIGQVINNLVINASQAMPDGGRVMIKVENANAEDGRWENLPLGNYVAVSIKDEGPGIPKQQLRKVFDPYFTTKEKGTGLGLATSYSIIKQHGGVLSVRSKVGHGSTFTFFLPADDERVLDETLDNKEIQIGSGRILVMDDEEMILDLTAEFLQDLGYDVTPVSDGNQAVFEYKRALKQGNRYDLVIMDLTIPGGPGGLETIKRLVEIDKDVIAIASSGYSNSPVLSEPETYGFKGILPKPYDAQKLSELVNRLIRVKQ